MELKEGLIVKTINYKENSKIVYIVSDEGLVSLEMKGANKLNSHTKMYSNLLTNIAFSSKGHFFQAGKVLNNYVNIKSDLNKLNLSLKILEFTYASIEHITNFKIFYNFLIEILDLINDNNEIEFYYSVFFIKVSYLLGVQPVLNKCVKCSNTNNLLYFVLKDGGMKCNDCISINDKLIKDKNLLNAIYKMYFLKLDVLKNNIFDFNFSDMKEFIDEYYNEFLGYVSKSDKVFNEIKL